MLPAGRSSEAENAYCGGDTQAPVRERPHHYALCREVIPECRLTQQAVQAGVQAASQAGHQAMEAASQAGQAGAQAASQAGQQGAETANQSAQRGARGA
jgi:hypothetical protein